jgi:hypothetical protein
MRGNIAERLAPLIYDLLKDRLLENHDQADERIALVSPSQRTRVRAPC